MIARYRKAPGGRERQAAAVRLWPLPPGRFGLLPALLPVVLFVLAMASFPGGAEAAIPTSVSILYPTVTVPNTKRMALVIGNGAYENVPKLANPVNDARSMAEKLQGLGYQVYFAHDLGRLNFDETIGTFLQQVGPGTQTLVYYAGHGIELNGSNYLIPVDIPRLSPDQEYLLRSEAVNLTDLLIELKARSPQVTLVILDACRDNPFQAAGASGTRSLGQSRGLGRVDPPQGAFVIYSAGVGEEALDNLGPQDRSPHGLFTRKLLALMDRPGLEIRPMVQQLRAEVRQAALQDGGHDQTPSYYDQLLGQFYFMPKSLEQPGANACDQLVNPVASGKDVLAEDIDAGVQACAQAVMQQPDEPRFVRLLQAAQEQQTFRRAMTSNAPALSNAYLVLYPQGRYTADVRQHFTSIEPPSPPVRINSIIIPPKPSPEKPGIEPGDIARVLQSELKRVGCDPGSVDGNWGDKSIKALSLFNHIEHKSFDVRVPTLGALKVVRVTTRQTCAGLRRIDPHPPHLSLPIRKEKRIRHNKLAKKHVSPARETSRGSISDLPSRNQPKNSHNPWPTKCTPSLYSINGCSTMVSQNEGQVHRKQTRVGRVETQRGCTRVTSGLMEVCSGLSP